MISYMCRYYLYFHPLISGSRVFNMMEDTGSIVHMEADPHFLVTGPTQCVITSFCGVLPGSPCSPLRLSLPQVCTPGWHWEGHFLSTAKYSFLCGSLVRTEFSSHQTGCSWAALQSTLNFLTFSLAATRCFNMNCLPLKTNENTGSRTTLRVSGGVRRMCGKKRIRLGKIFRIYTFLFVFYI